MIDPLRPSSVTFCGRTFAVEEVELMRQIAGEFPSLGVTEIARTVCDLLEWKRPGGGLSITSAGNCWSNCAIKAG